MRGKETIVLDLRAITPLFDFFVISTGTNTRLTRAIAEEVDQLLKDQDSKRMGIEGLEPGDWIVEDHGDVVLHVFTPESRRLYDLERLWGDAPQINWKDFVLAEAVAS